MMFLFRVLVTVCAEHIFEHVLTTSLFSKLQHVSPLKDYIKWR